MFRAVMLTSLALVAATVAAYRLSGAVPRADFAYVNQTAINTLDPAAVTWNQDIRVALNVWEGLAVRHPQTSVPIDGCGGPPEVSPDGRVYTFTIQPGSRWSNGDPVTAHDFVRGWRRSIEPGTAADYAFFILDYVSGARGYYDWRNQAVSELTALSPGSDAWRQRFESHAAELDYRFSRVGVEALGESTFQVILETPCSYFLDLCAFPTLLPIHESIERLRIDHEGTGLTPQGLVVYDPQWTKPDYHVNGYPGLITNGAYRVKEWTFKRRLRLEANPFFREADSVACETIDLLVYSDLNTAIMAYEAGDLDFLPETNVTYDHELVRLALSGERPDFHSLPVFGTYYYLFNCEDASFSGRPNPFVDPRVRKAFALAVDKRLIAEKVVARGDPPTDHIIPVNSIAGYRSPAGLGHDPDAARALLADAGYPGGVGLPVIDLLYNTGFHHGKICDVLAEMWRRELGAVVAPRGKEVKSFVDDRKNRRFMVARAGWYGDYGDPTTYLDLFATGNGNNDAGYSDAEFDQLLARAGKTRDPAQRMSVLADAEARLIRETFPAIALYQYTQLLALKPYVQGLYPNARLIFPFRHVKVTR